MKRLGGFTLVEMLVALALVSLMSLAMLQAYRFSQRALAQTTRVEGAAREVATTQRLLRRLFEQAYPFEPSGEAAHAAIARPLEGGAQTFALSAPAAGFLSGAGLYRYSLQLNEAGALVMSWRMDRNGVPEGEIGSASEELLEDVAGLSIAYLELIKRADGTFEPHWTDDWAERNAMPALVRIRVAFREGDRRRWPELFVAPRVNTDANCVFDVVSQLCRIPS